MRRSYPSDVSQEKFEKIRPLLESSRKKTKPRVIDLYDVFCGVLYVLKSGCQWRMLPSDLPKWQTCYKYFTQWRYKENEQSKSILEEVLKKIGWRGPTQQWSDREN